MKKLDFNSNWFYKPLSADAPAIAVTLPHDAMLSENRTANSRGAGNIGWFEGGDYAYTKRFFVPEDWQEKEVVIEFEGVYCNAEVWLNAQKAYFRPYGYTNFYVNTRGFLRCGQENEIRVIARNAHQPNNRWYSGTGIYRPVYLHIGGKDHIPVNGVRIRTVSVSPAVVEIRVETVGTGPVSVELLDGDRVLCGCTGQPENGLLVTRLEMENPQLWSCEQPKLYTCRVQFGGDVVTRHFGLRLLEWSAEEGLTINAERVILRGACIHHDNGILGACAFPEAEERKVRLLKENGYNAIRSAHNPCSKALLDACDRLGMLVMDEYADAWYIHKTQYDYASHLQDWWQQDLKDMVDKDYNHPSVILYSTGNEVSETAQKRGIELTGQMTDYLHALDDTRPVTCGINIFFNFLSALGFGVYTDEKARKNAEAAAPAKKQKQVGSAFYNMLAAKLGDNTMKLGATLPPCDWTTRDAFANLDIAGYNYGLYRYGMDLRKYPKRLIVGSETFCKDSFAFWEIAKKEARILGDFVWPGITYMGETHGVAEYQDYRMEDPATHLLGGHGRIDLIGKPTAEAAYTKVAFEQEPGPRLAVLPVYEREKLRTGGWHLTSGKESWSWRGCEGKSACVEVYARAAEVALILNGKPIARKRVKKNTCRTLFRIPYENGVLTAESYDANGVLTGSHTLVTAGEETVLRLLPEVQAPKPGELVFVHLQYTDAAGIWKPMERHTLTAEVENGQLVAVGCANPYHAGKLTGNRTDTYFGDALAVIRAGQPGKILIRVTDEEKTYTAELLCRDR